MTMIEVAIVEDDSSLREGLAELIAGEPEMRCKLRYGSVEAALADRPAGAPQVILLDIHLPGMLGSEGVAKLCARYPGVAVLMLTVYEEQDKVFESICNGASGYLLKKTPPAQIAEAVRQARDGGSPLSPEVARRMVDHFRRSSAPSRPESSLTDQERELLKRLAEGHSYQACADRLGVSINTIRDHVRRVYEKLRVHSKSEAVSAALRRGLID